MVTETPHVFRDNNQNTKTKNVLDKGKGEIPFPEKCDCTLTKDSGAHTAASAPVGTMGRAGSRRKGGQYFSTDRSGTPDTSSAFSLLICSSLLLLQKTTQYFTSVSMPHVFSFSFF